MGPVQYILLRLFPVLVRDISDPAQKVPPPDAVTEGGVIMEATTGILGEEVQLPSVDHT